MLFLIGDDRAAHEAVCRRMLDRFGATRDSESARRTCWACLASTSPIGEMSQLVRLADVAASDPIRAELCWRERGLAAYRADDLEGALYWCTKSRDLTNRNDYLAENLLVEAMAHHQLGRTSEAKKKFDDAIKCRDAAFPSTADASKFIGSKWLDWAVIEILRREAEATLKTPIDNDANSKANELQPTADD
jgi:tetratricopeptide (TPR) repeat protein